MPENTIEFPLSTPIEQREEAPRQNTPPVGPQKVLLLGLDIGAFDAERSLRELAALAEANGMEAVAEVLQKRARPEASTVLGAGRLAEAKLLAANLGAETAIYDGELTGSQIKNLENRLGIAVIDRTMLILQIFASRAVTREGKAQTELATLEYRLPRLTGLGQSLSRQGGGAGGGAGARRGGGETKLEYDRRYVRSRIAILKKRLEAMQKQRNETRRARAKSAVPLVALVGYTNVGKSSLVNALTGSDIPVQDMLFATLDPTARHLTLPNGQDAVLIDTVGFVSRLPHNLVEAFKSTLEEASYADLLVLVCDAADPEAAEQLAVTEEVLKELGAADTPRIIAYNKCDLVPGTLFLQAAGEAAGSSAVGKPSAKGVAVSAATGEGLDELKRLITETLADRMRKLAVLLPYDKLSLADTLRRHGKIYKEEYRDDGVYFEATVQAANAAAFTPYLCK